MQVVHRIFPAHRGLFEDYLANFWCTTSVAIKWRQLYSASSLMPVCAGLTILFALPSMIQQIMRPSKRGLLLGMANSAFAFYMFSYQVGWTGQFVYMLMALLYHQPLCITLMQLSCAVVFCCGQPIGNLCLCTSIPSKLIPTEHGDATIPWSLLRYLLIETSRSTNISDVSCMYRFMRSRFCFRCSPSPCWPQVKQTRQSGDL